MPTVRYSNFRLVSVISLYTFFNLLPLLFVEKLAIFFIFGSFMLKESWKIVHPINQCAIASLTSTICFTIFNSDYEIPFFALSFDLQRSDL